MTFPSLHLTTLTLLLPALGSAQSAPHASPAADSSFAAVKARGGVVMGVDQEASEHIFEDRTDGGRVVLRMKTAADTSGVMVIRRHLRATADSFSLGVFRGPLEVHNMEVPGSAEMARRRGMIRYQAHDIAAGAEVVISSTDSVAVAAIHAFLAFQRMDHHAAGHDSMHLP